MTVLLRIWNALHPNEAERAVAMHTWKKEDQAALVNPIAEYHIAWNDATRGFSVRNAQQFQEARSAFGE